jgi:YD repeat-containing protein
MSDDGGRAAPRVAVGVVVGLLFGTITTLLNTPPGDYVLDDSPRRVASLVFNAGAAWAGVAVLGGWLVGSTLRGLIAGPVVLILAVVSYYLAGAVTGSENPDGSVDQVTYFGLASILAGPVLGAAGGRIRRRDVLGLVSALVVPLGVYVETIWRASMVQGQSDPARPLADIVLVTLATVGAAVAVAGYVARLLAAAKPEDEGQLDSL